MSDTFLNQKNINGTPMSDSLRWQYVELREMIDEIDINKQIEAIIILMLVFRTFIYFQCAPLIKLMINVLTMSLRMIFNLSIILFISIFSFALLAHFLIGTEKHEFSSLFLVVIQVLKYLFGFLDIKSIKNVFEGSDDYIIISFLFLIRVVLFTFTFGIIKTAYEISLKEFDDFMKLPHIKLMDGTLQNFIFFWQLFIDYVRIRQKFKDIVPYNFVFSGKKEKEDDSMTYQKITFEGRLIYLVCENIENKKKEGDKEAGNGDEKIV